MLVLTRKAGEGIWIGDNIRVTVSVVSGNRVKLCVDAPRECAIRREEIATHQRLASAPAPTVSAKFPAGAIAR